MRTQEKEGVDFNEFQRDRKIIAEYDDYIISLFKDEYHVGSYYWYMYFDAGIFKTLDEAKERVINELLRKNLEIKDEIKEIKGVGIFRKEQKQSNRIPFVSQQTMGDGSKRYRLGFVSNKGKKEVEYTYAGDDIFYDTKEEAENTLNAIKKDYVLEEKPVENMKFYNKNFFQPTVLFGLMVLVIIVAIFVLNK